MTQDIPLTEIDAQALPRDRAHMDPEALDELRLSILQEGLRHPIEVWRKSDGTGYGLISGHRRLTVFRQLERTAIPAVLRTPASVPEALSAMVSENEIRAQISPWEKAMLVLTCCDEGLFQGEDAAIAALFPAISRQKRARLRNAVAVAHPTGPEPKMTCNARMASSRAVRYVTVAPPCSRGLRPRSITP